MKTPVFDADHRILGYLEHSDAVVTYQSFPLRCQSESICRASIIGTEVTTTVDSVQFQWGALCSSRSLDEYYRCRVLIADKPELLGRINGFRWFAEEHGERIVAAQAHA